MQFGWREKPSYLCGGSAFYPDLWESFYGHAGWPNATDDGVVGMGKETLLGSLFQLTNKAVPYFSTENFIFFSISFRSFSCLILVIIWLPP